jgi:flagellar basal-body rod modification protein FlgD
MGVFGATRGTKTWTDKPRTDYVQKQTADMNNSSQEIAQSGAENVGDLLNKVADQNYVDPSKKLRTVGSDKMDKDAFMKLMIAQMKHQDPTNPLKSHEMAAQLAQFSSVEQLTNINSGIEALRASAKPAESFQALNFIGKSVSGDSAKVTRMKNDTYHDFSYTLPDDASKVSIKIQNANGDVLKKIDLNEVKKGGNNYSWNGQDDKGNTAPMGEYSFVVEAVAKGGKSKLNVKTDFDGIISGVSYTPEGPLLLVGNQSVKLKDVKKIVDPSLKKNDQKVQNTTAPDLKNQTAAVQTKEVTKVEGAPAELAIKPPSVEAEVKGAQEAPPEPMQTMLDTVSLSGDMKNKLARELR